MTKPKNTRCVGMTVIVAPTKEAAIQEAKDREKTLRPLHWFVFDGQGDRPDTWDFVVYTR